MNVLSVILSFAAGVMAGFLSMLAAVRNLWPDLYEEMRRRSEEDEG